MSGRHVQREANQAPCCHQRYQCVIIVNIITVICISHGRVLVLTPQDEQKGSQRKQSVEGRHLFFSGWLPGLNRGSLGQQPLPFRDFRGNPLGRTGPRRRLSDWNKGQAPVTGEALRGFGAKRGFQLQATLAGRPSSKERIGSSGHSPQSPLLGSGSAPRTVPSPPTPELPVSCLRVAESLARNRAAGRL